MLSFRKRFIARRYSLSKGLECERVLGFEVVERFRQALDLAILGYHELNDDVALPFRPRVPFRNEA